MSSSSQRPKQITLQRAESTWYGCQIAPGAISGVIGSKSTRRHMSILVPPLRHTALVGGNCESDGPCVPASPEERERQQSTRGNVTFPSFSKLFWNFAAFFL